MRFSCILTIITFALCLGITLSSEGLYVVQNRSSMELTCISEDDDAAFIWNYDLSNTNDTDRFKNFEPVKPMTINGIKCLIWKSNQCFVQWKKENGWSTTNSRSDPMSPVVDYRWEGFTEFDLNRATKEYRIVPDLPNSLNDSLIFSVRGTRDIEIRLCANDNSTISTCFLINIVVEEMHSSTQTCVNNITSASQRTKNQTCEESFEVHQTRFLDTCEWRAFRLQWIGTEKIIKLFTDTNRTEFLSKDLPKSQSATEISFKADAAARIKFHIYDFYLETRENAVLHTDKFIQKGKNFCANILLSLCPECELNVSLIDGENNSSLTYARIFGDESHYLNRLRTWRSITVNMTFQNALPASVRLQITTVLNRTDQTDIWWAIDNLRFCEETDGIRESSIVLDMTRAVVPEIKCQKLRHSETVTANLNTPKPFDDVIQLRKFIREKMVSCSPEYQHFNGIDCISSECKCYQGFGKVDGTVCFAIVPGKWNVTLDEGSNSTMCSMTDSILEVFKEPEHRRLDKHTCPILPCTNNFTLNPYTEYNVRVKLSNGSTFFENKIMTLESAPEMIDNLIFDISAYKVTGEWKPPFRSNGLIRNYTVTLERIKLTGCEEYGITSPPFKSKKTVVNPIAQFGDLNPYSQYNFTVVANTIESGSPLTKNFTTTQLDIPTTNVSNLRLMYKKSYLAWDGPEDCTLITGPTNMVELKFSGISDWAKTFSSSTRNDHYKHCLRTMSLEPYTQYKVSVYITRQDNHSMNLLNVKELHWTTASAAPPRVKNIFLYEVDIEKKTTSIKWERPYPAHGVIESYEVSITSGATANGKWSIKPLDKKWNCTQSQNYVYCDNFTLPSNISTNSELELQIFAKNTNVTASGAINSKVFVLDDFHQKALNQPENITVIPQSRGVVVLEWKYPLFSPTKVVGFRITVGLLRTDLLTNPSVENRTFDHLIRQKKEQYSEELHLLTSTEYCFMIEAVDCHNRTSNATSICFSAPGSMGFAEKKKITIKMADNMDLVKFTVPPVVNGTRHNKVIVTVEGISTCREISSDNLSSSTNESSCVEKWIAAEYQLKSSEPLVFQFEVNQSYVVEKNCSFQRQEIYKLVIMLMDTISNASIKSDTLVSERFIFTDKKRSEDFNIWLVVVLIPIMCSVPLFIWFRIHRKVRMESSNELSLALTPSTADSKNWTSSSTIQQTTPLIVARSPRVSILAQAQPHFYPVSIMEFEEYVEEALASRMLESQYEILPKGFSESCEYGYLPENRSKNQSKLILPYDENRIVLQKIPDNPHSDYINASYIEGYRKAKAYIATQGPLKDEKSKTDTVSDFWRMVWQENVHVICMLTNVIEDGQKKCEQYWPEIGKSMQYGASVLLNIDHRVFTDYTIRTFHLICPEGKRQIKHFHYTGWPEHGIPMYTQSLVTFLKKLLMTPAEKGPIVVHGYLGVGRTGTFIICDISLRQALKGRVVNIPTVTQRIRRNRANMVDNVQQYVLAHLVVVECLIAQRTQIHCTDQLKEKIEILRKQLPSDVQRLRRMVWQDKELHSLATRPRPVDDFIPNRLWEPDEDDPSLARLSPAPVPDIRNGCCHEVSIEGFQRKKQYLTTGLPSPHTLSDFWRLVGEKSIELIVVLQRPDAESTMWCEITHDEWGALKCFQIEVAANSMIEDGEYFTKEKLLLTDILQDEVRAQPVTVLTFKGWKYGRNAKLPAVAELVSFWMASEKIQRKERPTMVVCRDGVTGCGLYLALSILLDQISLERKCDVISAVRAIQRFEQKFVQSLEQFEYLYDAAINYNAYFDTYANFS